MSLEKINLQITTPSEPIVAGRGFYQQEDDCLFVQVGQYSSKRRFFSYLESDTVRFDIDKTGKLIFIEITIPRRQWWQSQLLETPKVVEAADIRWMDFRKEIQPPSLITDSNKTKLKILFKENKEIFNYYLSDNIIAEVNVSNELTAIWVTDIIDDRAGREIRNFRKKNRLSKSYFL